MNIVGKIHVILGLVFLGTFLCTGVYMKLNFPGLYEENETMRMMYRSTHIYLLMSSLINIALGSYFVPANSGVRMYGQVLASILLLVSPVLMLLAFVVEPAQMAIERPYSFWGVLFLVIGVNLHMLLRLGTRQSAII